MTEKSLESLIFKIVKKVIKKEIKNLNYDNLPIISSQENQQIEGFIETFGTPEVIDDIYANGIVNLSTQEDVELERKLRELKFKQELRKDWILFILRDVIVYSTTILFMFIVAGFYLFTLIKK
ncbi:hypothetical protein VB713_08395 [Anabaena cylindrica UHCC 0172]|uniref:hypothetical protein n=1 Tax=Anabaena cylindrica TaxID=1165 RepID=UPI002B1F388B|nr:hypothetical protein [Anabaena cylindrica]MEA5550996.1 hypothetical protein [Anabaena cylindrica UHCC 0172]